MNDAAEKPTPTSDHYVQIAPHRPWLGPAIASGVALVTLLLLLIPGVLLYPRDVALAAPAADPATRRAHNEALEARIRELEGVLDAGVCIEDGRYTIPPVLDASGVPIDVAPEDRARQQARLDNALPPPADRQPVAPPSGSPPSPGQGDTPATPASSLLEVIDKATVLILTEGSIGSGFFIGPNQIVTNRHVVTGSVGSEVKVSSRALGAVLQARIAAASAGEPTPGGPDFALLTLIGGTAPAQVSFAGPPDRLTQVVAGGFPALAISSSSTLQRIARGDATAVPEASVTEGVITLLNNVGGAQVAYHNAQITPGNSGGPLLDRCGRVVGMNTFVRTEEQTGGRLNAALATPSIVAFLQDQGLGAPAVSRDACSPAALPEPAAEREQPAADE